MFRKTTGAILCPSCGRLTNADAPVCLVCGRRNPGMWGFGGPLARLFRSWNFANAVTAACIGLLGAIVAFGRKRGGVFGQMVLRQYGQWALVLFVLGFFMPGVNNWAHAGGSPADSPRVSSSHWPSIARRRCSTSCSPPPP